MSLIIKNTRSIEFFNSMNIDHEVFIEKCIDLFKYSLGDTKPENLVESMKNEYKNSIQQIQNMILKELNDTQTVNKLIDQTIYKNLNVFAGDINTNFTKEINGLSNNIQDTNKAIHSITDVFLSKNASIKGATSENILETQLSCMFPNYDIERTTNDTASGDFILRTNDKPDILLENKNYKKNVHKTEVEKFLRDVQEMNISGILVSQSAGISGKNDFSIDFVNNNRNSVLYSHNCNYDTFKIKLALDIIYSLDTFISKTDGLIDKNNVILNKVTFMKIKKEYEKYLKNKYDTINTFENGLKQLKKLELPSVESLLEKEKSLISCDVQCNECDKTFPSLASLSAHQRYHKKKTTI